MRHWTKRFSRVTSRSEINIDKPGDILNAINGSHDNGSGGGQDDGKDGEDVEEEQKEEEKEILYSVNHFCLLWKYKS